MRRAGSSDPNGVQALNTDAATPMAGAVDGGKGGARRTLRERILRGMVVPIPIIVAGHLTLAVVVLAGPWHDTTGAIFILVLGLLTVVAMVLATTLVGRRVADAVSQPLADLARASERLAAGELDHPLDTVLGPGTPAEVHVLAESFATMATALAELLDREREASARLAAQNRVKDDAIGIVAHDLRTPMQVIAGYAETLRVHGDRITPEQRDQFLDTIGTTIRTLSHMVDGVLEAARIEGGDVAVELAEVDVLALCERTLKEVASAHPGRPMAVMVIGSRWSDITTSDVTTSDVTTSDVTTSGTVPPALADEQRTWQILTNLVANACKYSPADAPVRLEVAADDQAVSVAVIDCGAGIHPDDLPRLFQKFSRLTQAGSGPNVKGTGLGLWISRALAKAQGATIEVASTLGEGSTFTLRLPVAPQ